jgi:hypothetical protein
MRRRLAACGFVGILGVALCGPLVARQTPLAPVRESGQTVTPVFEGWYRNGDASFTLSFGYLNRNSKEIIDVPIGPDNFIKPGDANQGQPTHFVPRRHWGVFAVRVPANFGDQKVIWTLTMRGQTTAIPGSLRNGWEIDALQGEAGSGNTPPVLKFGPTEPSGQGPAGVVAATTRNIAVKQPLTLTVWATDDGKASGSVASAGRANVPVTLTWFLHQAPAGAADVTFASATPPVGRGDSMATTTATFGSPGAYMLRVRANDASGVAGAGHAQCCWTNGFVKVTVTGKTQ